MLASMSGLPESGLKSDISRGPRSANSGLLERSKLFARDHLRKNRCTTPKAGLESVAEVDIYQQATRRQRKMKPYLSNTALVAAVERKYDR